VAPIGFGVGWIAQAVPFHRSASVTPGIPFELVDQISDRLTVLGAARHSARLNASARVLPDPQPPGVHGAMVARETQERPSASQALRREALVPCNRGPPGCELATQEPLEVLD
jgi:hypothetical protein